MKIKLILARLQDTIGSQEIISQMVLLPETLLTPSDRNKSTQSVNLVVGYNSSPSSQTALDIALLIAHQTRLATQKQVTVHVVYVQSNLFADVYNYCDINSRSLVCNQLECAPTSALKCATSVLTQPKTGVQAAKPYLKSVDLFEQADRILWQARCLAEEWKGTFVAHLRFGSIASELRQVVESEVADLLLLGCNSTDHPLVQQLDAVPCVVLGVPGLG
ncbi:MAG TPA: universal stress protein [Leptolyngbyaceae cyanobacterium]